MNQKEKGRGRDAAAAAVKARYLAALRQNPDRIAAARSVGMDEVQLRSWRHNDAAFNAAYKAIVIGGDERREREDAKDVVIKLMRRGYGQRIAADLAKVAPETVRTWKRLDPEFKKLCNEIRSENLKPGKRPSEEELRRIQKGEQ